MKGSASMRACVNYSCYRLYSPFFLIICIRHNICSPCSQFNLLIPLSHLLILLNEVDDINNCNTNGVFQSISKLW